MVSYLKNLLRNQSNRWLIFVLAYFCESAGGKDGVLCSAFSKSPINVLLYFHNIKNKKEREKNMCLKSTYLPFHRVPEIKNDTALWVVE